jgi:hypothetical protein
MTLVEAGGDALDADADAATAAALAIDVEDRVAKQGTLKLDRRLALDLLQLASACCRSAR